MRKPEIVFVDFKRIKNSAENFFIFDRALGTLRRIPENRKLALVVNESLKQPEAYLKVARWLLENGADRQSKIVAAGGGVIGDLAGFVASTYMRGIDWINVPTTLLAQVDSCYGGKTGIHLGDCKNILGTFHAPRKILIDTKFLRTLPTRDFFSGMAEILKMALIADKKMWLWLSENRMKLLSPHSRLLKAAIAFALDEKRKIVERDPLETKGIRARLNFGHTYGHALESLTAFRRLRHGEAVLKGMEFALRVSERNGLLLPKTRVEIVKELDLWKNPYLKIPPLGSQEFLAKMKKDKKALRGRINMVLLRRIGEPLLCEVEDSVCVEVLREMGHR